MAKKEKRGLFQSMFGRPREPNSTGSDAGSNYEIYRLLSSWTSDFTPFSGNAWDISTVRIAVDAWARHAAKILPRHIRRNGDARLNVEDSAINRILQTRPNEYMTAYAFYYRVASQFVMYNNAFVFPAYENGNLVALYPINASRIELRENAGIMYARMIFATGKAYICPYDEIIHLRRHYLDNDIFGDDNRPLLPVLETANAFTQSMGAFAKLISTVRGILKVSTAVKTDDLNKRRDEFIRDNMHVDRNGSGVIVTDGRYDYQPITEKQIPLPAAQLEYIRREVYDYIGVNAEIVQNTADAETMNAFYRGELSPFYMQLSQAFTNCLFTERERGHGNAIICELDRLQFETLQTRTATAQFLTNIGALELDQVLDIFGFPPIGGDEGRRRVQTLNMANVQTVDNYQLGNNEPPPSGVTKEDNDNAN